MQIVLYEYNCKEYINIILSIMSSLHGSIYINKTGKPVVLVISLDQKIKFFQLYLVCMHFDQTSCSADALNLVALSAYTCTVVCGGSLMQRVLQGLITKPILAKDIVTQSATQSHSQPQELLLKILRILKSKISRHSS